MSEPKVHLVKQVNHYSDGSEQVINFRGVVEQDGSVTLDKPEEGVEEVVPEAAPIEEAPEPEVYDGPMGSYKIIAEGVEFTDESGKVVGSLEVGSIQELPKVLGDSLVKDGEAEEVLE